MTNCPQNIQDLFDFLFANHEYNKIVQEEDIRRTLASYDTVEERALRLLHEIVNTQSQPKLDHIARFFQRIEAKPQALMSYDCFSAFLGVKSGPDGGLFNALKELKSNGWGDKTSALFVRNLAVIASSTDLRRMFWPDIQAVGDEPIRLPVDKVIKAIFRHLRVSDDDTSFRLKEDFGKINCYLRDTLGCTREEMLVWDDLWFWGFITQKSKVGTDEREYQWNDAKYWSIFTAPKATETIAKIELLATGKVTLRKTRVSDDRVLAVNFLSLTGAPVSPAKSTPHASATVQAQQTNSAPADCRSDQTCG